MVTQARSQGYIPVAERVKTFFTLIIFLLALMVFPDYMQSYTERERIAPFQARLMEVASTVWGY